MKPHRMVTGSVSPSTHLMGLLSSLARHWLTTSARSFSSSQINYEITKTQLTTQQIHPSPRLFTWDCDSTVNTKTSFVPLEVGNLHTDVTVQLQIWKWFTVTVDNLEPTAAWFTLKEPTDKLKVFMVCLCWCVHVFVCDICIAFLTLCAICLNC